MLNLTGDMGNTVTGQNINFHVNGILGGVLVQSVESDEGYVTFTFTVVGEDGDLFPVNGSYDGIKNYSIVINEGLLSVFSVNPLNITKINTSSSISAKDTKVGKSTTINGVVKDINGNLLANTQFTLTIDGKKYIVTTNGAAEWSLKYTPTHKGNINVQISFAGNTTHNSFVNTTSFNVANDGDDNNKKKTKITLKKKGNKITATLTDEDRNPIANKKIILRASKGRILGIGITNKNGQVTFTYNENDLYLEVSFDGDNLYNGIDGKLELDRNDQKPNNPTNDNSVAGYATMKDTGMAIIAVILVLLASLGLFIRKQN